MSRSGYVEDDGDEGNGIYLWRANVARMMRGKAGQAALREVLTALDAMEVKELVAEDLVTPDGAVCTLGALGKARGLDLSALDPEDYDSVAEAFGLRSMFVQEVEWANDEEGPRGETPAGRWQRMRRWVERLLLETPKDDNVAWAIALACGRPRS